VGTTATIPARYVAEQMLKFASKVGRAASGMRRRSGGDPLPGLAADKRCRNHMLQVQ